MTDIHALSGPYAVDALDDAERDQFERHLAECPACRTEVDSLREAGALMAETTATEPPPSLRQAVLAGIANVRPLPPQPPGKPGKPEKDGARGTVVELAPRRRRRLATFLAAAAAAVVVGTGGIAWHEMSDSPSQSTVSDIQSAGDLQHVTRGLGPDASATVYRSKKLDKAYIATHGMPPAPTGKEYVLWLLHGDTMTQAGVMPAGPDNNVVLSGDAATADGAAVSIEDAGTSPTQPSDDIVAAFPFA